MSDFSEKGKKRNAKIFKKMEKRESVFQKKKKKKRNGRKILKNNKTEKQN